MMRGLALAVFAMVCGLLPTAAAVGADTARLVEIYMEELRRETKVPAALAAKLITEAGKVTNNPKLRAALYDKAYEYGIRTRDGHKSAMAAMEAVLKKDPDADGKRRAKLIKVCQLLLGRSSREEKRKMGKKLLSVLADAGQACLDRGDGEQAGDYYKRAGALARTLRSRRAAEMDQKARQANVVKLLQAKVRKWQARLKLNAKDTEARMGLITCYLVELDAPAGAAKYLDPSVPAVWRKNVPLAVKDVDDLDEADCLAMGKWYVGLIASAASPGKATLGRRAAACLERYIERHGKEDASTKAAKALLQGVNQYVWIDLLKLAGPSTSSSYPRLQIPLHPEGSFDLQVRFVWGSSSKSYSSGSISVYFPARGRCYLNLGERYGSLSGITAVDSQGKRTYSSSSWTIRLVRGRTHTLEMRVLLGKKKRVGVSARMDGGKAFSWQGQPSSSSSSIEPGLQLYGSGGGIRFVSAKLRMLSGKAKYLKK